VARRDRAALWRRVERKLALLDQLHAGRRCDRLGHRGNPEHAIGGHGSVFGQVAFAIRALIDNFLAVGSHCDHAGNLLGVAFRTQNLIDLSFALHGVTSGFIFLVGQSSSRLPLPASMTGIFLKHPGRRLVIATPAGKATELQHSP
jgi:hypothetical protein